jgi:hypothetical protein
MSDPDPDDPPSPAASPPTRSIEAARRLSRLLARPLGTPAPPGETPEPYVPRPARSAPPPAPVPPPAPAPAPPDDSASVAAPPPVAPADEPELPWFDRPAQPTPAAVPVAAPEHSVGTAEAGEPLTEPSTAQAEPYQASGGDDDLFDRHDPPPMHASAVPADEPHGFETSADREDHAAAPRSPDQVPEWAWPSALDREPEAVPAPRAELGPPPAPLVAPAPVRAAPSEPIAAAPPAARPLDPDATRALGNIRRLMLASNLFMVVAIGAVLAVVGYRIYRTEPALPPPPPVAALAPAKIPLDMTLTLPRGARILGTAIAGDRLVITIQIDGATEIRTFDIKTLQPAGRLSFATVP